MGFSLFISGGTFRCWLQSLRHLPHPTSHFRMAARGLRVPLFISIKKQRIYQTKKNLESQCDWTNLHHMSISDQRRWDLRHMPYLFVEEPASSETWGRDGHLQNKLLVSFPPTQATGMHFPTFLAAGCGHVTELWPMAWKLCPGQPSTCDSLYLFFFPPDIYAKDMTLKI